MSQRAPLRAFDLGGSEICPPAPHCSFPSITSGRTASGEVGIPFSFLVETGGDFVEFTLIGLPSWASFDPQTNLITGVPDASGTTDVIILASNACSEGVSAIAHLLITIVANVMVWGNWASPIPAAFTEDQIIKALENWAPNAGGYNVVNADVRQRTAEFSVPPYPMQWRQVIWVPTALLGVSPDPLISITVNGFNFPLDPAPGTEYQSLSVGGVPGKIFLSANANNGGFTSSGGNPIIIS